MSFKIAVTKDGEPIKFKRGGQEVEAIDADRFIIVSGTERGEFSVDSNNLPTEALLGNLEVASLQTRQDFIARNYGTKVVEVGKK